MLSDKAIEEYQLILLRNPSAKVFAPLAEAYRRMGLLQQALEICEKGVHYNADYPSGLVAYGKVLFEIKKYEEAANMFKKAAKLKPDNILAHKLCALSLSKLNKYADALKVYKQVLYLNPNDMQAQKFIKNWEYLEAKNYSKETFQADDSIEDNWLSTSQPSQISAFVEALIARNELSRAERLLKSSLAQWPQDVLLKKQLSVVQEFRQEEHHESIQTQIENNRFKKTFYSGLLRRVELAKKIEP